MLFGDVFWIGGYTKLPQKPDGFTFDIHTI